MRSNAPSSRAAEPEESTLLLQLRPDRTVCLETGPNVIARAGRCGIARVHVLAQHVLDRAATHDDAAEPMSRQRHAPAPCLEIEWFGITDPRQGMTNDRDGDLESLPSLRGVDADVSKSGTPQPIGYGATGEDVRIDTPDIGRAELAVTDPRSLPHHDALDESRHHG